MAKQTSSYGIEIRHAHKIFYRTITLFNEAVSYCIDVFEQEWADLSVLPGKMRVQKTTFRSIRILTYRSGRCRRICAELP